MKFKAFFFSSPMPVDAVDAARTVISSDALREAALRKSWQRDRRVAQRRKAWRWVLFWTWKYGRKPAAALVFVGLLWAAVLQWMPESITTPLSRWSSLTQSTARTASTASTAPPLHPVAMVIPSAASFTLPAASAGPSSDPVRLTVTASLSAPGDPIAKSDAIRLAASTAMGAGNPLRLKAEARLLTSNVAPPHFSVPLRSPPPRKDLSP